MYSVFLDGWQFPVTPSKLDVSIKGKNQTLTLVNDGEVNFLKTPGLTEIKNLEAVLPMLDSQPFAVYQDGFKPPEWYLDKLEGIMLAKKPVRFVVSRLSPSGKLLFGTNLLVSLESYEIKENAKNGLDVTVSLTLKQYRPFSTKVISLASSKANSGNGSGANISLSNSRDTSTAPTAKTYVVKSGDSLWGIAKTYTGDGARYTELYNANKGIINNPSLIYPGQVLTLPW